MAPVDAVYPSQMRRDVLNGTRAHALVPNAQVSVVRSGQQVAGHAIEANLRRSRHANGAQREDRFARVSQVPQMGESVDGAAGQKVRRLGVPVDVRDDSGVGAQRMDQQRVARSPGDHFDQLAGGDGAVLLAGLANGPFGSRHFVFGVTVKLAHAVLVLVLV